MCTEDFKIKLYKLIIVYTLIMLIIFLAVCVLYREYTKAFTVGGAEYVTVAYYLSLSHGHVFLSGAVIPSTLLFLTYIVDYMGLGEINYKGLFKAFTTYIIGSLFMVSLLVYKGLAVIYYYRLYSSLAIADNMLFLGNHALRETLYGGAHLLLGIGIIWYVILL